MSRYDAFNHSKMYTNQLEASVRYSMNGRTTDSYIAGVIADYLHGYIDTLPETKRVVNVIRSIRKNEPVSEGFGVKLSLVELEKKGYYELVVLLSDPVDNSKREITDKITSTNRTIQHGTKLLDKNPMVDDERANELKRYLGGFGRIKSKEAVNQVTDLSKPIENEKAKVNVLKMTKQK